MTILGPLFGHGVYLALITHAAQPGGVNQSGVEAIAQMQQFPSLCSASVVLLILGGLCGVAGFFLVTANLVLHLLGQDASATSPTRTPRHRTPAAQPSFPSITHGSPA